MCHFPIYNRPDLPGFPRDSLIVKSLTGDEMKFMCDKLFTLRELNTFANIKLLLFKVMPACAKKLAIRYPCIHLWPGTKRNHWMYRYLFQRHLAFSNNSQCGKNNLQGSYDSFTMSCNMDNFARWPYIGLNDTAINWQPNGYFSVHVLWVNIRTDTILCL